jgi:hypothetical protein
MTIPSHLYLIYLEYIYDHSILVLTNIEIW